MHSFGNSFVFLMQQDVYSDVITKEQIVQLCDYHFGIGADGVVLYNQKQMRIFNRDGSEAEMCGNATRCLAVLLARHMQPVDLETLAGQVKLERLADQVRVTLNLNKVPRIIPLNLGVEGYYLTVGVPHFIVYLDRPQALHALDQIGEKLAKHFYFQNGTNVDFVTRMGENVWELTTWERGVGLSLSCGTGAMSVGFLNAVLLGLPEALVKYGPFEVQVRCIHDQQVSLTGALPQKVAKGVTCLI